MDRHGGAHSLTDRRTHPRNLSHDPPGAKGVPEPARWGRPTQIKMFPKRSLVFGNITACVHRDRHHQHAHWNQRWRAEFSRSSSQRKWKEWYATEADRTWRPSGVAATCGLGEMKPMYPYPAREAVVPSSTDVAVLILRVSGAGCARFKSR